MKTYAEKLKDPRWQRKRLEVLNRDNFTCLDCGDTKKTLHVHHCSYVHGREPWDYDDSNFRTLCEACHETRHDHENMAKADFSFIMASLTQRQISRLAVEMLEVLAIGGEIRAICSGHLYPEQIESLDEAVKNP